MINFKHNTVYVIIFLLFSVNINTFAQLSEKEEKILEGFLESAKKFLKNEETNKAANQYYKAGILCFERNENLKAIPYLKEAAKIHGKNKEYDKVMKIYSNLGLLYANISEYDKSLLYFQNSLKIRKNLGNQAQISSGLLDLAYVLSIQQKYKDAIINVIKALEIASDIQDSRLMLISYRMLAENYQQIGNEQKAAEYLDKYASYRQHFEKTKTEEQVSEVRIKSIAELSIKDAEARAKQLELELIKKNKELAEDTLSRKLKAREDSLAIVQYKIKQDSVAIELLEKDKELTKIQRKQDKADQRFYVIVGVSIIVFIALIVIGLMFNIRRRKKHNLLLAKTNKLIAEQNKNIELKNEELTNAFLKIEEQNKDINSSIDYAVNIQKSLLPKQENLTKYFADSFILFKPRDKVSGDFYWFKDAVINRKGEKPMKKFFVSAIDCTGHGVPGAFLSMMSFNLLDDIVEQKRIHKPGEILDELHNGVRKTLRQADTKNRDGMDMALCSYCPETNILEFAGAKNPMIYMKDGKMHRVKGNVKPIGGIIYDRSEVKRFTNNTFEIDSPTTVYIFSDGFADQTGEETNRKLMTKFFRGLLMEIHQKPMSEQRDILSLFLKKWQGKTDQIDDILVIGFKIYPNKI
ncbi:MAG: tetratricopeptide repeat protein [Bacteroidales bacterium]|nr:tetratricopeptide repeat protein [Bacteroidales bacterium]